MSSAPSTSTVGAAVLVGSPVGRKNRAEAPPATEPLSGPLPPAPLPLDEPPELVVQAATEAARRRIPVKFIRVIKLSSESPRYSSGDRHEKRRRAVDSRD